MQPIFTQDFFISAGDCNARQQLALTTLSARLIDIATLHANSLGIGNPAMENMHCGWVLSRLTIEMNSFPMVNQTVKISTWIEGWNRHFSLRCFRITDLSGNVYGFARTVWMVLNTETRENAGLSHLSLAQEMILGEAAPIRRQEKHLTILPFQTKEETLKKGQLIATTRECIHTFRYSDLDAYRHVNTVKYIALLLNQFTLHEMDRFVIKRIELSFLHEAHCEEPIELLHHSEKVADNQQLSSFFLRDLNAGTPILYARINMFS